MRWANLSIFFIVVCVSAIIQHNSTESSPSSYLRTLMDHFVRGELIISSPDHSRIKLLYYTVKNDNQEPLWFNIMGTPWLNMMLDTLEVTFRGYPVSYSGMWLNIEEHPNPRILLLPGESLTIPFDLRRNYQLPLNGTYRIRTKEKNCAGENPRFHVSLSSDFSQESMASQRPIFEKWLSGFEGDNLEKKLEQEHANDQNFTCGCLPASEESFVTITDALIPSYDDQLMNSYFLDTPINDEKLLEVRRQQIYAHNLMMAIKNPENNLVYTISNNIDETVKIPLKDVALSHLFNDQLKVSHRNHSLPISVEQQISLFSKNELNGKFLLLKPGEALFLHLNVENYFNLEENGLYTVKMEGEKNIKDCVPLSGSLNFAEDRINSEDVSHKFFEGGELELETIKRACVITSNEVRLNITNKPDHLINSNKLFDELVKSSVLFRHREDQPVRLLYYTLRNNHSVPLRFNHFDTPLQGVFADFLVIAHENHPITNFRIPVERSEVYTTLFPGESLTVAFDLAQSYSLDYNGTYQLQTRAHLVPDCRYLQSSLSANSPNHSQLLAESATQTRVNNGERAPETYEIACIPPSNTLSLHVVNARQNQDEFVRS